MRKPPFTRCFKDRHGKWRCYLRKPGCKPVALPGIPWTPEFMAAYEAALKGKVLPSPPKAMAGTITALVHAYLNGRDFQNLRDSTKTAYRNVLNHVVKEHGHRPVAGLKRATVQHLLGAKSATPHAANRWLKILRALMRLALDLGLRDDDPTLGVRPLRVKSDGFKTWQEEQVTAYRRKHANGTRPRLALEMLLGTMQRRGDIVRLGRQHVKSGYLNLRQDKTGELVEIPLLPELVSELASLPAGQMTFLMTEQGKSFTAAGFGNWFREQCDAAGIEKGYSAHGLRKLGAVRLAEAGCTTAQIKAWGGWRTHSEVDRYTASASKRVLADAALVQLKSRTEIVKSDPEG